MKRSSNRNPRETAERVLGACGHLIPGWPSLFSKSEWSTHFSDVYLCDLCEEWVPATARNAVPGQQELPFGD